MAGAYSRDLRGRVLAAMAAGESPGLGSADRATPAAPRRRGCVPESQ